MDARRLRQPPSPRGRRAAVAATAAATAALLAVWIPLHPPLPHQPTSDLYTHLSVARHLARGEGFLCDVAYPLSFAYPFARDLPQPLIHRMPGYAVALTLPCLSAGGDPQRALAHVRILQILLLGATAGLGAWGLLRAGRGGGVLPWLVLLGANPLLAYGVSWGADEVLAGLLLLAAWLAARPESLSRPAALGLLAGLTALVRLELGWVPLLWGAVRRRGLPRPGGAAFGPLWRMLAVALVVVAPWSLRNVKVTGQPFFTLQAEAELAKDTRRLPGYAVYRGLEPWPLRRVLSEDPLGAARKTYRGLRFYLGDLPDLLPWPLLLVPAAGALAGPARRLAGRARGRPDAGAAGAPAVDRRGPGLALATAGLLILLYAPFDHSLRHLLPLLPVLLWEVCRLAAAWPAGAGARRRLATGLALGLLGLAAGWAAPCRLPGWRSAAAEAVRLQPAVAAAAAAAAQAPPGVLFFEYAAVPWLADRPGVWNPADPATAAAIRDLARLR